MKLYIIMIIIFNCLVVNATIIDNEDRSLLENVIKRGVLKDKDLNFLKDWSDRTYLKNRMITNSINNIDTFIEVSEKINSIDNKYDFNNFAYMFLKENVNQSYVNRLYRYELEGKISIKDLSNIVEQYMLQKKSNFENMFIELVPAERETLLQVIDNCFTSNAEEEVTDIDIDSQELDIIVRKIKWDEYFAPTFIKSPIDSTNVYVLNNLQEFLADNYDNIDWQEEEFIFESELGGIYIGSIYDDCIDVHDFCAIINPSGNDIYNYLNTNQKNFFQLDFSGNDIYRSNSALFSAKSGFSQVYDFDGKDVYIGGDETISSKLGFSELIDFKGDDIYKGRMYSLSASMFGACLLADYSGSDSYSVGEYGEGFASTWGISLLLDKRGRDFYESGNINFHAPLAPNDYLSMSQGMGFGFRNELGGGIGILIDRDGNDTYNGGVYAQGVGYWYSLGILIDNKGNDFFNAVYYPQGSGIHLAGGFFYNGSGEDSYYSKHGPGQGAGHDFGVGIFIDDSGNDHYSVEGGNGLGLTNSVGIFLDKRGDDRYENGMSDNYGYGKGARSTGSIGIFIDGSGQDYYAKKAMRDSSLWRQGIYGIGIDTLYYKADTSLGNIENQLPLIIAEDASMEEIFAYASEWEVGNVKERVRKARNIMLEREKESRRYILSNKMGTQSGLEFRAIKSFFKNAPDSQKYIKESLISSDSLVIKNGITLVGLLKLKKYQPLIDRYYLNSKYLYTCISAYGEIKDVRNIDKIAKYSHSNNEKLRFYVASALKKLGMKESIEILDTMKDDNSFLIRTLIKRFFEKEGIINE